MATLTEHYLPGRVSVGYNTSLAHDFRREKDDLLLSVPGVGSQLSLTLLAYLLDLGALNRMQIASLVGVVPLSRDSGPHRGKRGVRGDGVTLRSALYMAVLVASRRNPVLCDFYQCLLDADKPKKVA